MSDIKLSQEQILFQTNIEKRKWENRRRMAWVSLFALIIQTLLIILLPTSWLSVEKITVMKEPITWAYWCQSAIILGYMGFTTWAYVNDKNKTPMTSVD